MGVKLFMCFPFSWGKRETHKQNSQEISGKGRESPGTVPGESRDNPVKLLFTCLLVYCFFFSFLMVLEGPNGRWPYNLLVKDLDFW